ncbi:MAG: HAD family hydrolase [Prevotella sp.]|nr:HAD family hydrolase [Prevotella sp.]MDY5667520.1 HAD family hydrolase [Alloprevotella sp.]
MATTYLFDYGGTLDTAATHWFYVFQAAYQSLSLNVEETLLRQAYVTGERALAKERIILPTDDFHSLLRKKITIQVHHLEESLNVLHFATSEQRQQTIESLASYCNNFAHEHVKASAQVLQQLHDSHKLVMVSNFYGNLHKVLEVYGILPYFDAIIESAVVGVRKPDPAIWQLGIDASGTTAKNCIAVGDSYGKDIVPAASIGCKTIWFKGREWEDKSYDETLPTRVITALQQLLV